MTSFQDRLKSARKLEESTLAKLRKFIKPYLDRWGSEYHQAPRGVLVLALFPLLSLLIGVGFFLLADQGQEFLIELNEFVRGRPSVFDLPRLLWFAVAAILWLGMLWFPAGAVIFSSYGGVIPEISFPPQDDEIKATFIRAWPRRLFVGGVCGFSVSLWLGVGWLPSLDLSEFLLPVLLYFPITYYLFVDPSDGFRNYPNTGRKVRWLGLLGFISFYGLIFAAFGTSVFAEDWKLPSSLVGVATLYLGGVLIRKPITQLTGLIVWWLAASGFMWNGSISGALLVLWICAVMRGSQAADKWLAAHRGGGPELQFRPGSSAFRTFVAVVTLLVLILTIGFAIYPVSFGQTIGAPAIVLLALASWSFLGTLLFIWLPQRLNLPPSPWILIVLAVIMSPISNNHRLPGVKRLNNPPSTTLSDAFTAWETADNRKGKDQPIFVVAASGGGLRAAYWTAIYLAEVDDRTCGTFGQHLFAISGVSGGSLGAAAYVSAIRTLRKRNLVIDDPNCYALPVEKRPEIRTKLVREFLAGDFLSPTVGSMLFPDTLQRFMPNLLDWGDRGTALSDSWSASWKTVAGSDDFTRPFLALSQGIPGQGLDTEVPMLFLNSTNVQDGKRVVEAPVAFSPADAHLLFEADLYVDGLTLSTAVLNSARFTYVSPPGTYQGWRYSRWLKFGGFGEQPNVVDRGDLVDGGYFDNSGAATAVDIIDGLVNADPDSARRIYVIIVENSPIAKAANCREKTRLPMATDEREWSPLPESLAPITALLNTRTARGTLAQQQVLELVHCERTIQAYYSEAREKLEIDDNNAPNSAAKKRLDKRDPALGWFLAASSRDTMDRAARTIAAKFSVPYRQPACPNWQTKPEGYACPIPLFGWKQLWNNCLGQCVGDPFHSSQSNAQPTVNPDIDSVKLP